MSELFQGPAAEALMKAQIDITRLESEVSHLARTVDELKVANKLLADELRTSNKTLTTALVELQRTLDEARGGWRMLMLMGGAGAAAGGFISWFLSNFRWKA